MAFRSWLFTAFTIVSARVPQFREAGGIYRYMVDGKCPRFCDAEPQELSCQATSVGNDKRGTFNADIFIPHGPMAGDQMGAGTQLGEYLGPITVNDGFLFFGQVYDQFYVTSHGFVHITKTGHEAVNIPDHYNDYKTFDDNGLAMVSVFWSDFDASLGGAWGFRELNANDLQLAVQIVKDALPYGVPGATTFGDNFSAGFVMTYDKMILTNDRFYENQNDRTNTLQSILVHDGVWSYVIFHYGDVEQDAGHYTEANTCTGDGGWSSWVGFKDALGLGHIYQHPLSHTENVKHIEQGTNCGVRGRYVFKVDGEAIEAGTIETDVTPGKVSVSTELTGIRQYMNLTLDDELPMHGCHCANFDGTYVVDEVDHLCKEWTTLRRCLLKPGGACENLAQLEYTMTNSVCDNNDLTTCAGAACAVDVAMGERINALMPLSTTYMTAATCPMGDGYNAFPKDTCCGTAPYVVAYNKDLHTCQSGVLTEK